MSSADYGVKKPHPLIFETALAKLEVDSSTTWFVGDTLEADIAGANESGLFSIWYNPDGNESGPIAPNATIRSWTELEELVDAAG